MNDTLRPEPARRSRAGRLYLFLGLLLVVAGPLLFYVQLRAKILRVPVYVPILATLGVGLMIFALTQARSVTRWVVVVLFTAFTAFTWAAAVVELRTPPYEGPARAGQAFPAFTTTRADGSPFTQDNFKGDKNTVLFFFRGRW
jgi:hypothetical protein